MQTYRIIVETKGQEPEEVLSLTVGEDTPKDSCAASAPPSEAERLTKILESVGKAALFSAAKARGNGVASGDWKQFRADGMLWYINRQLHLFGWVIVLSVDTETGEVVGVRPMRVNYDGFSREDEIEGYAQVKAAMSRLVQGNKPAEVDTIKGEE